jgi:hypothetical protein
MPCHGYCIPITIPFANNEVVIKVTPQDYWLLLPHSTARALPPHRPCLLTMCAGVPSGVTLALAASIALWLAHRSFD